MFRNDAIWIHCLHTALHGYMEAISSSGKGFLTNLPLFALRGVVVLFWELMKISSQKRKTNLCAQHDLISPVDADLHS